jgi:hypothetical protein
MTITVYYSSFHLKFSTRNNDPAPFEMIPATDWEEILDFINQKQPQWEMPIAQRM